MTTVKEKHVDDVVALLTQRVNISDALAAVSKARWASHLLLLHDEERQARKSEDDMKDDGGPAFSQSRDTAKVDAAGSLPHPGMSLRQWYAGLAMQGYRAAGDHSESETIARWSKHDADALIAELEKE